VALFNSSASESLYIQKSRLQQVKRNLEQVKLETVLVFVFDFDYFCSDIWIEFH